MLGMKDTISEEDMLVDVTKIELEKRLDKFEKENSMLKEDNESIRKDNEIMKRQIAEIAQLTAELYKMKEVMELEL